MFAPQVTLTTANTVYNLQTLVKAIDAAEPGYCHQLTLQADIGNGEANVFIGDSTVSSSTYGVKLPASGASNYESPFNAIDLANFYLVSDTNSAKVNVQVVII
jgi:hypothetical protein